MSEVTALIAEIKSKGLLRAGDKLEELYVVAARIQAENLELKAQRDALAAEMSVMDAIHDKCVFITDDDYDACPKKVQEIIRSLAVMQIPATDAWLNFVRDSFVDEAIHALAASGAQSFGDCMVALNKLRAGEPS